jgi:MFS family permease
VLSAFVPDWYGRRATTYYSYFFPAICIALCAFVKNTTIYCILIFTAGVGLGNYDTSCMIYIVEISGLK